MALHTGQVGATDWPSIIDGERTDRGYEHFLQLIQGWSIATGDSVSFRLVVPLRETWVIEWMRWRWSGGTPVWTSGALVRDLVGPQRARPSPPPFSPWSPLSGTEKRTLYTMPTTDEEDGVANRSQIEPHIGGLRGGARVSLDFAVNTTVPTESDDLNLSIQVVRIPLAKERAWTKKDMANALTRIEELGRRVS